MNPYLKFGFELLKQGQIFFLLCLIIYGAWIGIPLAWVEFKQFNASNQQMFQKIATESSDRADKKFDEQSAKFTASIDKLVQEMKESTEALKRFAEAEEEENRRNEQIRREGRP